MKKNYHLIPAAYRNMLNIVDDEQQNYVNRLKISITAFNLLEEYITKVWKGRGISYDDQFTLFQMQMDKNEETKVVVHNYNVPFTVFVDEAANLNTEIVEKLKSKG